MCEVCRASHFKWPLSIKQCARARSTKFREVVRPQTRNLCGIVGALHGFKSFGIDEQARVIVNLPLHRIKFSQCYCNLQSCWHRMKTRAVCDDDIDAAALLILEDRRLWRETHGHETHARDLSIIQEAGESLAVEPGRADDFKWRVRAASDRKIRRLKQADAGIERGCVEAAHVRRGIDPSEIRRVVPHPTPPAFHLDDAKVTPYLSFFVIESCQLADGHTMPHGDSVISGER